MSLLAEVSHELTSALRAYPEFVKGARPPEPGEIPIFVFHTIEPERFDSQLRYLVENGYRTIDLAEYLAIIQGRAQARGGEVLLTIDDARSSVWRYGYPLLRRHGCKASVFVIAGWTPDAAPRPNLDDVDAGRTTRAALDALDPRDHTVCSWEELRIMVESGHVEAESHTHLHQRLFAQPQITGIIDENSLRTASDAAFSPYLTVSDQPSRMDHDAFTGFPLLPNVPLMACKPALRLSRDFAAEVRGRFLELREASGAKAARARVMREFADRTAGACTSLDEEAVAALVRTDLAAAMETLRERLQQPGIGVHLCLPFTIGSERTVQIARELGYRSVLWGVSTRRVRNRPGDDPFATVRLKNDFIWRLPGSGRRSLAALYFEKVTRRVAGITPY